jgi:hypothetical protein
MFCSVDVGSIKLRVQKEGKIKKHLKRIKKGERKEREKERQAQRKINFRNAWKKILPVLVSYILIFRVHKITKLWKPPVWFILNL